jgi:hypothetical protein
MFQAFKANATGPVEVWGHANLFSEFWEKWQYNRPLLLTRGLRQVFLLILLYNFVKKKG